MAAIGSNMSAAGSQRILARIARKMGLRPGLLRGFSHGGATSADSARRPAFLEKAGAPATNTAADAPSGLGDLCFDSTNNDVYRCTAYTNGTTFTWTKIVD
jgi:hypothetical protein